MVQNGMFLLSYCREKQEFLDENQTAEVADHKPANASDQTSATLVRGQSISQWAIQTAQLHIYFMTPNWKDWF